MMSLAAVHMKMSAAECWQAVTVCAAAALGLEDRGQLAIGKRADIVIWDSEDHRDVAYRCGAAIATRTLAATRSHD